MDEHKNRIFEPKFEEIEMNHISKAYAQLHIAIFLFGFTAILGALIDLSAFWLVWWRVLIASVSLYMLIPRESLSQLTRVQYIQLMGIGGIIALHWLGFYGAIKLSNASTGVVCVGLTSVLTSLLEPLLLKRQFRWYELLIGLMVVPGIVLIVQGTPTEFNSAILLGLFSALMAALFSILNKRVVEVSNAKTISFIELTGSWLLLTLISPWILYYWPDLQPVPRGLIDVAYLFTLAIVCTTWAFVLSLDALRHISAFASSLSINLEPVYGIVLGYFLLNDGADLDVNFYIGAGIILFSVLLYPFVRWRLRRKRTGLVINKGGRYQTKINS